MQSLVKRLFFTGLKILLIGVSFWAIPISWAQPDSTGSKSSKYTLGPDDVVKITVTNHPEFTGTFSINTEGKIQYAYGAEVSVNGLTKERLKGKIEGIVSTYVNAPEVSVIITEYKSKVFYVLGEIAKPGQYHMHSESITLKEAVTMAGLPTQAASLRKAKIFASRNNGGGTKEVDLYDVLYSGEQMEDIVLNPGDSLYIPAALTESAAGSKELVNRQDDLKYTLGPEDIIEITVMAHPEFSGIYPINQEGKIQYSYVGDINLTGMTKKEAEEKIRGILSSYVAAPQINIRITEFRSKIFYVFGEVRRPGPYHMHAERITVKEAVIMAGLPTPGASLQLAKIVTPDNKGDNSRVIDLYAVLFSNDQKENVYLKPGDTLYIPGAVTESATDMNEENKNFNPLRYTLGPDDVIEISVMGHPEFSGTYPISLEGKIQYKFVGDIYVSDMTKLRLEDKIKDILASYVSNPHVNVTVKEFKSKAFYVIGEVGTAGKFYMRSDYITTSEAIVLAGLPTQAAAMRKAKIITPGVRGAVVRKLNLYALLYEGNLKENLIMYPGDYLYVPSTVLAKFIRIFTPVATTIGLAAGPTSDVGNARAGAAAAIK